jgi:hypothetical protein
MWIKWAKSKYMHCADNPTINKSIMYVGLFLSRPLLAQIMLRVKSKLLMKYLTNQH